MTKTEISTGGRRWKFFRAGGLLQVSVATPEELGGLGALDPKLWVALACPVKGVEVDPGTLASVDTDGDGRIRPPEVIEAVRWALARMPDAEAWMRGEAALPLSVLSVEGEDGQRLASLAARVAAEAGDGIDRIGVAEVEAFASRFASLLYNGDGIVPPEEVPDEAARAFLAEASRLAGTVPDRNGKPGVNEELLDLFLAQAKEALAWREAGRDPAVRPLGDATEAAFAVREAVRGKVEDYFFRCRLCAFDPNASEYWTFGAEEMRALAPKSAEETTRAVDTLPLARIEPGRPLPLREGVNPAWAGRLAAFAEATAPLLGGEVGELDEAGWARITAALAPHAAWLAAKPATPCADSDPAALRALLDGTGEAAARETIRADAAHAVESGEIDVLVRLVRYRRDLPVLLRNFVNFADFYDPAVMGIFQAGRLYLDARSCELCFAVEDTAAHSSLAAPGRLHLVYCNLERKSDGLARTICAAFTAGYSESLWVGRAGVFYDRLGRDWDAVIVKVVENSISLREAFWSPWRKMARMVGAQVNKIMAAREAAAQASFQKGVDESGKAVAGGAPPPPPPAAAAGGAAMASSVAALGIALGFISTAMTAVVSLLAGMPLWKTGLAIVGLFLLVSGPSVVLTYFRIRSRDLAPVLNASGWAVNQRIPLPLKLARRLTRLAELPAAGAVALHADPYADKSRKGPWIGILLALAAGALAVYFLFFR
jgi:hypothetical protein